MIRAFRFGSAVHRSSNRRCFAYSVNAPLKVLFSTDSKDDEQKDHKVLVDMMSQLRIDTKTQRYDENKSKSVDFSAHLANKKWNDPSQKAVLRHDELLDLFKMAKSQPKDAILQRYPGLEPEQLDKLLKHYGLPVILE